jgi:hypothetical protein
MLFDRPGESIDVVESPRGFSERIYEGMNGSGVWPPLVRPGVLFDLRSYDRWERFMLAALSREQAADAALTEIASAAERLRTWTIAAGRFDSYAEHVLSSRATTDSIVDRLYRDYASHEAVRRVLAAVPSELLNAFEPRVAGSIGFDLVEREFEQWVGPHWEQWSEPVRRYLASKAFAAWTAYDGHGVRTLVAELLTAYRVLKAETARCCAERRRKVDRETLQEAVRAADLLLVHLADRPEMVRWFNEVERRGVLQSALPYCSADEERAEPLQI